jgi:2-polyprenyl-6-methoxyphenol hydroxylase-like FAD-dependent oxidoreductase
MHVLDIGAPIDALWMRMSRKADDPGQTFGNIAAGGILVAIDRNDYYQCALVIRKGGFAQIQARGLPALREQIATLAPFLASRVNEIATWDDVKLLTVKVDRLRTWYRPGLLCIGDAAHAMSPVGGVGINLAIQDAVAAANLLADPLRNGSPGIEQLRAVQRRREFPTRVTQGIQVFIQERVLNRVLNAREKVRAPALIRALLAIPYVRRLLARVVGVGVRPERVLVRERAS